MNNEGKIIALLESMDARLGTLATGQAKLEADISQIKCDVSEIKTELKYIWDDIGRISDRLGAQEAIVKKIM